MTQRQIANKAPPGIVPYNLGTRRIGLKVTLLPHQRAALDAFATKHGISRARAISDAVDHFFKELKP